MMHYSAHSFFHICNKSIANFGIFKNHFNSLRFRNVLYYYSLPDPKCSYSDAIRKKIFTYNNLLLINDPKHIKFISYVIMPDHYHILIKTISDGFISRYIADVENSYSRFFNIKYKRKGPLWQSRFRSVQIKSNEQLLHVSRYIHLNPTTSNFVDKPECWKFSSYYDYIHNPQVLKTITEISTGNIHEYKKFTESRIDYQRRLKILKKLFIE